MFAAHMSMYGVLSQYVPLTNGISIWGLACSLIPRVILSERPESAYEYYARKVNAVKGQGYTIHHATGWYLNFGLLGIILGAVLFAAIWVFFYSKIGGLNAGTHIYLNIILTIGLACLTAQIPTLIRSGPESYKALVFEAILILAIFIYLTRSKIKTD